MMDAGKIRSVRATDKYITGTLKETPPGGRGRFVTIRVEPGLAKQLEERGISVEGAVENNLIRDILSWILPVLLLFGIWAFFIRRFAEKQGMGGLMSIGKSKAKVYMEKDVTARFDDVAGVEEAKDESQVALTGPSCNNLVWQSVMCRPGKRLILLVRKNQMLRPTAPAARPRQPLGENAILILIVARLSP